MIRGDIAAVTSDMETEILDIRREGDTCVVKKQGEEDSRVKIYGTVPEV